MKWRQRDPSLHSVAEVVYKNTGMTEEQMEVEGTYKIEKMNIVGALLTDAVNSKKKVCVVADYDADGVCSAATFKLLLDFLGADSYIRIPRRMSEGYGLNPVIVDELPDGCLLICVDNGIVAFDAIKKAKSRGMTVAILDHHAIAESKELPIADVIIDPSALGEADFTGYCGAGLAYKLAAEMLGENHPVVQKCLSFAAIATVADVMPLVGENHFIVKKGLKMMLTSSGKTKGLAALIDKNGLDISINESNLGYKIAPCLNAPGRLHDDGAMKSYRLLACEDAKLADELSTDIIADNEMRKKKKDDGVIKLEENILANGLENDVPLILYESGLEEGLVGLYAGHFAEELKRPCIVFTDSKVDGVIKGSARSFGDVHLKHLLDANSGLIYKYGGHKGAAGLSIYKENLDAFRKALKNDLIDYKVCENEYYDLEIDVDKVPAFIDDLAAFAPYGEGNPEIIFKIKNYEVSPTNKGYVQTMCDGKHGKMANKDKLFAIAFGLGERLKNEIDEKPRTLDLYGRISMNISRFGTVRQVEVIDFKIKKNDVTPTNLAEMLRNAAKTH